MRSREIGARRLAAWIETAIWREAEEEAIVVVERNHHA
jgi:hypothetical protein